MKIRSKEIHFLQHEDIQLHQESIEFLAKVFDIYREGKLTESTIVESPIIHLYATEDTMNEYGELQGYHDSLFFEVHIYDTISKIKYVKPCHDSIDIGKAELFQTKIFKDGSTMMQFYGNYKFGFTSTMSMYKVD